MKTNQALELIAAERERQHERGHDKHDTENNPEEWYFTINDYNAIAHNRVRLRNFKGGRLALVKLAAVVVAYIEQFPEDEE